MPTLSEVRDDVVAQIVDGADNTITPTKVRAILTDLIDAVNASMPLVYTDTSDPTADDDANDTSGNGTFAVGSMWINTSSDTPWQCADASTGAAVWKQLSLSAGSTEFLDDTFRFVDNADGTKKVAIELSGLTTSTVRTITMPDENVTLSNATKLASTANGEGAALIGIEDAGMLFTAENVEDALAEVKALADTVPTAMGTITFIIDGGGSTISTGVAGFLEIPFDCTIQQVTMLADQTGTIVVDIWKDTYANYPPDNSDSITASAVPTITSAVKSQDLTLTGWTTSVSAGDILGFNVDNVTDVQRVTIALEVLKT